MPVNYDRDEFRKYLQDSGAVESLSRVFLKLYELKGNRPKSSIKFIQDRITDCVPSLTEYELLKENLLAMGEILLELKTKGSLDPAQVAAFEKIGISSNTAGGSGKIQRQISARHSQIVDGAWKKDGTVVPSAFKLLNDTEKSQAIAAFVSKAKNATPKSLLQKHLTVDIYTKCKDVPAGPNNTTSFLDCICSGLDIPESIVGVYATDAGAYGTYGDLFKPIIKDYHGFDISGTVEHPALNWGDPSNIKDFVQKDQYILWTRIRCVRNVENVPPVPLVPKMNENHLKTLCAQIKTAFQNKLTTGDVAGNWYELETMDKDKKKELIDKNYILEFSDKFLESVGATQHWPKGRAVYINQNETFFVWINEEDHLRFISMESGSNIQDVYRRMKEALEAVTQGADSLKFQVDASKKLGFVSLCPTNLGNTIRASVMMKLPKLMKQTNRTDLDQLIKTHNLEIRPQSNTDTIEISNKQKLGITEIDSIQSFCTGIQEIIKKEEA